MEKSQPMTCGVGENDPVCISLCGWIQRWIPQGNQYQWSTCICVFVNKESRGQIYKNKWYPENNQSKTCQTRDGRLKGLSELYIFLKQKQTNKKGLKWDNKNV